MSLELLKSLRFLIPGIMIVLSWATLGSLTGDWKVEAPSSISDLKSYVPAILAAVIYYLTPLRDWANRHNFQEVNQNIRASLIEIGNGNPQLEASTWPKIRRLFYKIIDSDENLKLQAKRAYFNGLIWTTAADLKAISIIFSVLSIAYHFLFDSQGALLALALFVVLGVFCSFAGLVTTRKHKEIGNEQLQIIKQFHKRDVVEYFINNE